DDRRPIGRPACSEPCDVAETGAIAAGRQNRFADRLADPRIPSLAATPPAYRHSSGEAFMGVLMIHHKVKDYAAWRPHFDKHKSTRKAAGFSREQVFQDVDAPNTVTIVMEFADLRQAQAFGASDDLKQRMKAAGVVGKPEIRLMNRAE